MKIVLENFVVVVLFAVYNYLCLAEQPTTIGALFTDEKSQARLSLASAVYTANTMQSVIRYNVAHKTISKSDSFKCCKMLCNMTEHYGLIGVFGPISLMTLPIIQSICSTLEIPHIQISWRPSANYSETVVNFFPDPNMLSEGLAVIVKNLQWKSFILLYENDAGLIRLQNVLKLQNYEENSKRNRITVKQLGPGPDYRVLLKEIKTTSESRIILDCDTDHIIEVLKQAKDVGLLQYYSIFLTSLDAHTLDFKELNTSANITTVRILNPEDQVFKTAVLNWQQYAMMNNLNPEKYDGNNIKTETALMHDAVNMFISTINELSITQKIKPTNLVCDGEEKWEDGLRIVSYLKEKEIPNGVTGPIKFDKLGRRINFTLYVVEALRQKLMAKWSPENPEQIYLTRNESEIDKEFRESLQGNKIIVSSRKGEPYLRERKPSYTGEVIPENERYEGFSVDLIGALATEVGFEFEFRLTEEGKYGGPREDGSWDGLIGDILERRAQLAICDLTITHKRREVVDFSLPFMTLGISILYTKGEDKDVNMFAFLDPFSNEVWYYTATLYLAVSIILYFVARMAPADWENPHPCEQNPEELENMWDIKNCLWLTLGSIMTQGCDILPKGISSRMATSMWWFFSLIMTSSYTANLAAFLTMQKMDAPIQGAEDLAKQTKIKYGTVTGGATQAFFKESNYSTYQRMWTNMETSKPSVFEKTNADGVKRVQTSKHRYAFLMESTQIEYEIQTKCDLKQVGNRLDSKGYGIAMPIDYPLRSRINKALLKLQEDGKLSQLKTRWWIEKNGNETTKCKQGNAEEEGNSNELALANVGGVFLVLGIGVAIAFLIAICEFLWNVRNVSVEEHLTYWEALKIELRFAMNIWITKKKTKPQTSESTSANSGDDSKSIAHSMLRGAGSFFNLDIVNKIGTPNRED